MGHMSGVNVTMATQSPETVVCAYQGMQMSSKRPGITLQSLLRVGQSLVDA